MNQFAGVALSLLLVPLPLLAAEVESFERLRSRAQAMGETPEGKAYEKDFAAAFGKPMQSALLDCTQGTAAPYTVNVVFVIAADGAVQRIVSAPNQPVSACVADKLKGLKLPVPPKPDWLVAVNIKITE